MNLKIKNNNKLYIFPDQYQEKYNEMQEWEKFAKEVARCFTKKQEG